MAVDRIAAPCVSAKETLRPTLFLIVAAATAFVGFGRSLSSAEQGPGAEREQLSNALRSLETDVFAPENRPKLADMLGDDIRVRRQQINDRSLAEWQAIESRADWEAYRAPRIERLRKSLGKLPPPPNEPRVFSAGTLAGEGFVIEKLVYEGRPGMFVTANLYRPDPARDAMPGILICHSHHRPKVQGELQDMGMTWARLGCLVLVPDQLGHGERREHPFGSAADYPAPFAVSRQDYYFRYDNGIELHLAGESLIGQFVYDLQRGVDMLLAQPGIDAKKIVLLGAVAGGGEPAAIAAALDERIACVAPFNFGGPQMPGRRFPLPDDIERTANYVGSGSWESTRNLRQSGAGGFLPWVIVASAAPRRLIFAHEFVWDRERDPVWKRLETIYGFYGARDKLGFTHGRGDVTGRPPEATHCTEIGAEHRKLIHPLLRRWFAIEGSPQAEFSRRREDRELLCLGDELRRRIDPQPLHRVLAEMVDRDLAKLRRKLDDLPRDRRRDELRRLWAGVLGPVENAAPPVVAAGPSGAPTKETSGGVEIERLALRVEREIVVPLVLLRTANDAERAPVVVMLAQKGKQALVHARAAEIAELLTGGAAVCLCDLRGTGETSPGDGRERQSSATGLSSSELMLGQTMLGGRVRDLRSVLRYLRARDDVDASRIALWGDSLAEINPPHAELAVPHGIDGRPRQSEPLGGALVLLAALFEDDVAAVVVRRGLIGFRSVLDDSFVYLPHDMVVPGLLECGDLGDLAAAASPVPLWIGELVDGRNCAAAERERAGAFAPAAQRYRASSAGHNLVLAQTSADGQGAGGSVAGWLMEQLGRARD